MGIIKDMRKIIDIDIADKRRKEDKLREILEYHCGFHGTQSQLIEIYEELEKFFINHS